MSSDAIAAPNPMFRRVTDGESVCVFCMTKVLTDCYAPLERAEEIHADVCLAKGSGASWTDAA